MAQKLSLQEALDIRQFLRIEVEKILFGETDGFSGRTPLEDAEEIRAINAEIKRVESLYLEECKMEETINLSEPLFGVITAYHDLLLTAFEKRDKDPAPLFKKFQATLQRDISMQMQNIELDLLPFLERHGIRLDQFVNEARATDYYVEAVSSFYLIKDADDKIDDMLERISAIIASFDLQLADAFTTVHDKAKIESGEVVSLLMEAMRDSVTLFLKIAVEKLVPHCKKIGVDPHAILLEYFEQTAIPELEPEPEGDLLDEGMMVDIDSLEDDFDDFDDDDSPGRKRDFFEDNDSPDEGFDDEDDDEDFNPGKKRKGW